MKDEFHRQFPIKFDISVVSIAKPKNIIVFAFTYCMCFALFYGNFCMDLYSVHSDEVMK